VRHLAELIRAKKVTSSELTEIISAGFDKALGRAYRPLGRWFMQRIPGFTADESLKASRMYNSMPSASQKAGAGGEVVPQFWTGRHFACGALAIAILAGQEELIPVAIRVCFSA
jgi:hypothetical protein